MDIVKLHEVSIPTVGEGHKKIGFYAHFGLLLPPLWHGELAPQHVDYFASEQLTWRR